MPARSHARVLTLTLLACAASLAVPCVIVSAEPLADVKTLILSQQNDLAGLLDLCSDQLQIPIEYDAKLLKALAVTIRLPTSVSPEQLLALTDQLLASRGFTTIQTPGSEVLSVVKLAEAAERARVEPDERISTRAGFVTVMWRVQHRSTREVLEAIKVVLSKPAGAAAPLGEEGVIVLSDLRPRIEQALWIMQSIDVPADDVAMERLITGQTSATQLAASIGTAVEARNALGVRALKGKLRPLGDENAVIVIAPAGELPTWRELVARFDAREGVETQSYSPHFFGVDEVGRLIEQSAPETGQAGSGDRWRVVKDDLTGTLVVTATPQEHQRIRDLMERLDGLPAESRRPVRSFQLRNRPVRELLEVLEKLIEAGILQGDHSADEVAVSTIPDSSPARQRSEREPSSQMPDAARSLAQAPPAQGSNVESRAARGSQNAASPVLRRPPSERRSAMSLSLAADEATNTLIVVGEARLLAQLEKLIRSLDVRQAQVMIEVLVVSLTDGQTLDLGVELQKLEISGNTVMALSSLFGLGSGGNGALSTPSTTSSSSASEGPGGARGLTAAVLSPGDFSILIRALETLNEGRSLSLPKVLVSNNQQATLDSVLQQPFTSTNASDTVATTSFGGTQDAGTTVSIKPRIAEADHLMLEYNVSLSSFVGESTDPALPPPRQQNNLQSIVSIPDGYTVVVGGLEIVNQAKAVSQLPLLGRIPLIGEAFKSRSHSDSQSRFFVFIRANVLRHRGYEDLKYLSDRDAEKAQVDDGWPAVEAKVIQ